MGKEKSVITVEGLKKYYGEIRAVDNVSFSVAEGEIFGMVGPNGAGKTTTIECIEGLRTPDAGKVSVLGLDPLENAHELRLRSGIQLQSSSLPPRMRVAEAMDLFASFYPNPVDWRRLLEQLGLETHTGAYVSKLSGGQRQRLFIALALVHRPEVVFLDELTTGLDPQARRVTWDLVRQIRTSGATVFLTTHLMDEAEILCDRVAVIDHGKILALDSPANLVLSLGGQVRILFQVIEPAGDGYQHGQSEPAFNPQFLLTLEGVQSVDYQSGQVIVFGTGSRLISSVVLALESSGLPFQDLRTEHANLEDVFLGMTGKDIRD